MAMKVMRLLAALTACSLFLTPAVVFPCGPVFPEAVFSHTTRPDDPLENFLRGELGILHSGYRSYSLVPAYRYLTGIGLGPEAQRSFLPADARSSENAREPLEDWVKNWNEVRQKVPGAGPAPELGWYSRGFGIDRVEAQKEYYSYLNCHDDAFKTAVRTLNERIGMFGKESPAVAEWLRAQDVVFSNCSKGRAIPEPAPSVMHPVLKADREYQIAAACFYSGDFAEAEKLFRAIARDKTSSWNSIAPYLAARALVRNATLNGGFHKSEAGLLSRAEATLQEVLKDDRYRQYHQPAKDLLGFVQTRLRPGEKMHELVVALLRKDAGKHLQEDLQEYRYMLMYMDEAARKAAAAADDLTDWVLTFQDERPESLEHALERWEQTASQAWLVAAMMKMQPGHPKQEKLRTGADKLLPTSPAYPTAVYHSLRLLIGSGRQDIARKRLDALFAGGTRRFSGSSVNLLTGLRMQVSTTLDDFLRYAERSPVAVGYDYGGGEVEDGAGGGSLKEYEGRKMLDSDSVAVINGYLPLSILDVMSGSPAVTARIRRDIAMASWTRAVIIDDEAAAKRLVPVLSALVPEMKQLLGEYSLAASGEESRFLSSYILLKYPAMKPFVVSGIGRTTPIDAIDNFRDNWWCSFTDERDPLRRERPEDDGAVQKQMSQDSARYPAFLASDKVRETEGEIKRLRAAEPGPNYLAGIVLHWARSKPDDPRVPEALHLLVKATRYGCADDKTTGYSKEAFKVLHKKYPRSEWTRQTPYYF